MVVRTLNILTCSLLLAMLLCTSAQACFGPKLFVGVGEGEQSEVMFALATLYVEEKTGVESIRVAVENGQEPRDLLSAEKVDLVFVPTEKSSDHIALQVEGLPLLASGKRPLDELQFTTVLPALKKLNRLLTPEDVDSLVRQVNSGESAMAVVRKFFMERRWI